MSSARLSSRFSGRVFLIVVSMLLGVSVTLTGYFVVTQTRQMEDSLADRSQGIAGLLANSARAAIYAENAELLQETLRGVVGRQDVLASAVFSPDGRLIAAEGRTPELRAAVAVLESEELPLTRRLGAGSGCADHEDEATIEAFCPVLVRQAGTAGVDLFFGAAAAAPAQQYIGFVDVLVDRTPLRHAIGRLIQRSLGLLAVILLLGAWAARYFARRVSEPLERLTEAVRAFGAGGTVGDIPGMPDNEIGKLTEAFTGMTRDLREREREKEQLAERLRHAEKMEAVGALSQGVAHDFKNILSTLKVAVHLLEKGAPHEESVQKYTGRMRMTLERGRELIERLLTFSRTRELRRGVVDLRGLLEGLAPSLRTALGDQVRLQLESGGGPVAVWGDGAALEQLLMNLAYNARDAMPDGGVLSVSIRVLPGAAGAPDFARLSVGDTGVGMEAETQARAFEPYFTTKGPGAGTGLGLSIVRGIVDDHQGCIGVESAPGRGTTFHVDLPLAPAGAAGADERGA